jgi:hypothetical protein
MSSKKVASFREVANSTHHAPRDGLAALIAELKLNNSLARFPNMRGGSDAGRCSMAI